jgi:hypothetical protein
VELTHTFTPARARSYSISGSLHAGKHSTAHPLALKKNPQNEDTPHYRPITGRSPRQIPDQNDAIAAVTLWDFRTSYTGVCVLPTRRLRRGRFND